MRATIAAAVTVLSSLPSLAVDEPVGVQLARAEKIAFGKSGTGPALQRLAALEQFLNGRSEEGSIKDRLATVNRALGVAKGNAPKPSQKQSAPATASSELPPLAPDRRAGPSPKVLLQLGTRKVEEGDTLNADAIFRRVLVLQPSNVDAMYNLGALAERRGDLVSALGWYQSALKLKAGDLDLHGGC